VNASESLEGRSGSIIITTSEARENGARAARLEVADTGAGMSGDTQARIFDPFFTTRSVGRGLGLSAVQGIVRRLNGSIHVESAPGAGSRFEIVLPGATDRPQPPAAFPAASVTAVKRPITVLFIDDEEALRSSVSKLLRKRNF